MALRLTPHGEDLDALAGGDPTAGTFGSRRRGRNVPFSAGAPLGQSPGTPPGNGKDFIGARARGGYRNQDSQALAQTAGTGDEIENEAQRAAEDDGGEPDPADGIDFLTYVRDAKATSSMYIQQQNRRAWSQSFAAYQSEHFKGSKFAGREWRHRSKFFRPRTRTAVKKDMAAVAASLFGNIDAINCLPGNESDPRQRAAAAVIEELVNYRTDRASGKASFPWFLIAMGAREDALITGICLSKQTWKFKVRPDGDEDADVPGPDGVPRRVNRDVYVTDIDRPNVDLIPPENFTIDPAADWTAPIQSAQYVLIDWPMSLEEIHELQDSPVSPWNDIGDAILLATTDSGTSDTSAIRRAREGGQDRMTEAQNGQNFKICWITEVFMRVNGVDYTFFCAGDKAYLTDPKPTREVYPEQFGDRPLVLGIGNLDSTAFSRSRPSSRGSSTRACSTTS